MSAIKVSYASLPGRALTYINDFREAHEFPISQVCKKWQAGLAKDRECYLDPRKRPQSIRSEIYESWKKLQHYSSCWVLYNGSNVYTVCGLNEQKAILKIIEEAPVSRKAFFALDIGAGNFQWGASLAEFLNAQSGLEDDITVHIISVRGELNDKGSRDVAVKVGRCILYNLGGFKIEDLQSQLKEHGFPYSNFVDFATSRWCFRHLVDPLGTFVQTYNVLRPETGRFSGDGFFMLQEDENEETMKSFGYMNYKMRQLLFYTKAPFLLRQFDSGRSLDQFILKKPNHNPCRIPISYKDIVYTTENWQIESKCVTRFTPGPEFKKPRTRMPPEETLIGDRSLYLWIYKNELFNNGNCLKWNTLTKASELKDKTTPLHKAVLSGSLEAVSQNIREENIDDPTIDEGETALLIATRIQKLPIVELLLERGAKINLGNFKRQTPLHAAVKADDDAAYVELLLKKGPEVNPQDYKTRTPLYIAQKLHKEKSIALLEKRGAIISEWHKLKKK